MMNSSRVVHVGKFYPPHMGGIETHLQNLCRALSPSHRVHAIVANDGSSSVAEMDGAVRVLRAATRFSISSAPFCPGIGSAVRELQPDILHLHLPNPAATIAVLTSGYTGPLITTYHSDVIRQKFLGALFEPVLHRILHRSSAIICTSQAYMDSSPALVGFRRKCVVIPYGIPASPITFGESQGAAALRKKYGPRLIVSVGRLVYYKGFEYLIEAMKKVHGKLLIVGDGPLRASLEAQVRESGLQDKVHLLGEIQNDVLAPYYRAADVFALASVARSEAFGIVQLEAMAYGLPVVNTALDSGVPFVSRHNQTGLTVPPRDASALAHALDSLLADRPKRAAFGAAAKQRVRSEFTVERMARRTSQLYADVRAGRMPERGVGGLAEDWDEDDMSDAAAAS